MRIGKRKSGRFLITLLVFVMVSMLMGSLACTPSETELLKGVLQIVDSANGEITIVTKDGKTVTVKITTETEVATEGDNATASTLEPGASVEVKIEKESRVAKHIEARQAEVEGTIVGIEGNKVTIESEGGSRVTLLVDERTRIELEDDFPGTVADFQVGVEVKAKFDPSTRLALKIEVEEEREEESVRLAPTEGWGIIEIRVTDPPPADVKSAVVHLSKIEVHRVSANVSGSDNKSGWITILETPPSFDLMDVIGVQEILGSANVTAGSFTQIRMDVTEVTGNTTDDVPYTAEVPSDKLKIVGPFNVGAGTTTILTIDFDGEKSLIRTGSGKFLFKPVVKLLIEKEKAEQEQEQEQEKEQEREREFEGTIETINGDNWTMTIGGKTWKIDVSEAEIDGEPAVGLRAKVEGVVVDDTIKASEVEIKKLKE